MTNEIELRKNWDFPALNELTDSIRDADTRGSKRNLLWPEKFLNELYKVPNVGRACKQAGISRGSAYTLRKENELFAVLWEEAYEFALDNVAERAYNRAMGTTPQGAGDDQMLRWYLAKVQPDKFGDRKTIDHTNSDGMLTPQVTIFQLPDNTRGDVDTVEVTGEIIELNASESETD